MTFGLIGKTLIHSYSKEIHELLGKYEYDLLSFSPEEMKEFIKKREFDGLNITIPYKKDVIPLCDSISDLAKKIGAVNTLYWKSGELIGHNTDYEGFLYAARRANISFKNNTVLILGSGGTSLTARLAALSSGAKHVIIASRNKTNISETPTKEILSQSQVKTVSYEELDEIRNEIDVIINTTPVGTFPNNLKSVISLDDFKSSKAVIDVIYNPFKTKLLLDAQRLGIKYTNGLPMLVAQATASAGYFLGTPGAFESENENIISKLERHIQNIVLIGMPGCGKSTIGKIISSLTGKKFIDMDEEIEKEAEMSIPEIFDKEGEKGFRIRESAVATRFGKEKGLVISTGGGTVLKQENIDALKQNGIIIHIKRDAETLATKGRPLSKDLKTLKDMEKKRLPYYETAADITFDNSKSKSNSKLSLDIKRFLRRI